MEYAFMFSLMGTWIVWLHYRNYKLMKGMRILAMLLDKTINKEVIVSKNENGFEVTFTKGE